MKVAEDAVAEKRIEFFVGFGRLRQQPTGAIISVLATRLQMKIAEAPILEFFAKILNANLRRNKHLNLVALIPFDPTDPL